MHSNIHHCSSQPLQQFLFITILLACICASSVQSTGGGESVTYFISTVAGNGAGVLKVNVPAPEATFGGPIYGMAQGKNGDLYVSAGVKHIVLKFEFDKQEDTWTNVTIIAGTGTVGKGDDDILGTQSALSTPMGLSLIEDSSTGEVTAILIADWGNSRIRKLDVSTWIITTIAVAGLFHPQHVFYDQSNGDIYIAETDNHRIRRVRGGTISTVVGKTCSSDGLGDGGLATDACLNRPYYFTMNEKGEWFIVDFGNKRIRKVDSKGIITTVAGGGTETEALAKSVKLMAPSVMDFTPSGGLLVVEDYGEEIRKMDHSGFMKIIAGGGSETPSSDTPIPAKTAKIAPRFITYARDGSDAIFIGDYSGFIFKLTSSTKCYGVGSDNAASCTGHGYCIGEDQCQCDVGWMRLDCSITHCFGFTSNHPDVCSGKGKCVKPDECHCNPGHRGHYCQRT